MQRSVKQMRRDIVDILKYITKSYINAFILVSVVVNVLAAIKSSQLLWVLNYTLWNVVNC